MVCVVRQRFLNRPNNTYNADTHGLKATVAFTAEVCRHGNVSTGHTVSHPLSQCVETANEA